jgi:hypothetical protein
MRSMWGVLSVLLLATGASAQEREIEASPLPRDMADRLIRIVNDPATLRFEGETDIPGDSVVPGNMVAMGPLRLAGRVEGDVIVIGGDVDLRPGFEVRGDLTVVQGEIRGDELGRIDGLAAQFSRAVSRAVPGTQVTKREPGVSVPLSRDVERGASSHFAFKVGDFNRVEGLQLRIGPVVTTGGPNPFRTSAHVIWRTQGEGAPLTVQRRGFRVEMEQFVGGDREWRVGAGVHSVVSPIEAWGITDRENAWSTILFTSDHRDHFERRGWNAFARATPRSLPLDARLGFEREQHGTVAAADPWSLFQSGREWRTQPLVAEGSTRSLVGRVTWDSRQGLREPSGGWLVEGTVRQGLGGSLAMPDARLSDPEDPAGLIPFAPAELGQRPTTAFLDVRRYNDVGPGARLNLRGVAGGSLRDEPLPPQYQHALGGIGSLPGHPRFAADCGARQALASPDEGGERGLLRPFYGCDRFALFQAEYRGALNLRTGFGTADHPPAEGRHADRHRPSWVVFFNAGRAWAAGEWGDLARRDSPTLYDAGLGLLLGQAGVYWAVPMGDEARGSRLFVRLERRF